MEQKLNKVINLLEKITSSVGKTISWLNLILIITLVYEVICRYIFNSPTIWSFDISYMLGGTMFSIGAAWALKKRKHVRVDILYSRLTERKQAIMDLIFSIVFFFPLIIGTVIYSTQMALFSWQTHERMISGYWNPPIYPLKSMIPLAFLLLLIQGVAELLKNISLLRKEGN